jgi:hypothetical protein
MNRPTCTDIGILIENQNDGSAMRNGVCPGGNNIEVCHLVVVDARDVEFAVGINGYDTHVGPGEATVGTTIDE